MYKSIRANEKIFAGLRLQWEAMLATYNEDPVNFAVPYLAHAQAVAAEKPAPRKYGVFVLQDEHGVYHGLFHANLAGLPKTTGKTLRILWNLYSPKYEYEDVNEADLALLVSSVLFSAMLICREWKANHIKVRLSNNAERRFAHGFAISLRDKDLNGTLVEVRGNWLHIDNYEK
jgi:hypothetical protein